MLYLPIIIALTVGILLLFCLRRNNKNKNKKVVDKIYNGLTYQTRFQFKLAMIKIGRALKKERPRVPESFNMDISNEPDKIPAILDKVKVAKDEYYGVDFAIFDEDKAAANPSFFELLIGDLLTTMSPIKDIEVKFDDDTNKIDSEIQIFEDNTKIHEIYKTFEHTFIDLGKYEIISDHGLSLMAFSGLGCHYTTKYNEKKVKSAQYILDLRILGDFAVRKGFVRYGAAAYFNSKYEIIGIFVCNLNKMIYPNDKLWDHSKWTLRVSITTMITIKDHLLYCHEIEAKELVQKTREYLPFDHPLRRFLKPFCFRTIFINHSAAKNLIGKKQLVHRTWSFEYETVNKIMNTFHSLYKFELFKNKTFCNGEMSHLPDEIYPITTDLNEYWSITHKLVTKYMSIYYKTDNDLIDDEFIHLWYKQLMDGLDIETSDPLNELNIGNLNDILTHLIINGSAWHQYVGNTIQEYLRFPYWMGAKIRPNSTQSDIQSFIQVITIGILTGLPMPDIASDWKFVLLHDSNLTQTSQIFDEWQQDLKEMSKRVKQRNTKRRMPVKFVDPAHLDSSVGI